MQSCISQRPDAHRSFDSNVTFRASSRIHSSNVWHRPVDSLNPCKCISTPVQLITSRISLSTFVRTRFISVSVSPNRLHSQASPCPPAEPDVPAPPSRMSSSRQWSLDILFSSADPLDASTPLRFTLDHPVRTQAQSALTAPYLDLEIRSQSARSRRPHIPLCARFAVFSLIFEVFFNLHQTPLAISWSRPSSPVRSIRVVLSFVREAARFAKQFTSSCKIRLISSSFAST